MQNLKVSINLASAAILDRFITIDGILLALYYSLLKENGRELPFDPEHKTVEFIHKQDGVFSGSIWYVNKDEPLFHDFLSYVSKSEHKKIFDHTKNKKSLESGFKNGIFDEELMTAKTLHFYIRGDKDTIEGLLVSKLENIGKKASLGYGEVSSVVVEEIENDLGYKLNDSTASKPLPVNCFNVDSKKIAYFRRCTPYWLREDLEACYMPTSSLFEHTDTSNKSKFKVAKKLDYISNVKFIYEKAHDKKVEKELAIFSPLQDFNKYEGTGKTELKRGTAKYIEDNTTSRCCFTNEVFKSGFKGNVKKFLMAHARSFTDYNYINRTDFLSNELLWCIANIKELAYSLVDDKHISYLQGSKKQAGTTINDYLVDIKSFNPPFSINLKDTQNSQHVSFKGKVSISNAFFIVQYGNSQLNIDGVLLEEAIKDMKKIVGSKCGVTKTHLCGNFDGTGKSFHATLSKVADNIENHYKIEYFQKKYNKDIRTLLSSVRID